MQNYWVMSSGGIALLVCFGLIGWEFRKERLRVKAEREDPANKVKHNGWD